MYPENPEGTQVILGFMNIEYISDTVKNRTHNLFCPKREPIPLGHSGTSMTPNTSECLSESGNVKQARVTYSPTESNESPVIPDNVQYKYSSSADQTPDKLQIKFTPFINTVFVTVSLNDIADDTNEYRVWLSVVACFKGNSRFSFIYLKLNSNFGKRRRNRNGAQTDISNI